MEVVLMEIEIIDNIEKLKDYRCRWDEILYENNNDNPFLEQDWLINWWKHFGSEYKLYIILIKHNDNILGFCPLMKIRKLLYTEIRFISYRWCSYMDFIISNEYREQTLEYLISYLRYMKGNYVYSLDGIFETSKNLNILMSYLIKGKVRYFTRAIEARYIDINGGNFEDYYKTRSKHNSIKQVIQTKRKLSKLGELNYGKLDNERINEIFILHEKRWKKKLNGSTFSVGESREFFKQLVLNDSHPFKVDIYSLLFNDKLIAFVYAIKYNGRFLFYRVAHDDDFSKYRPGLLIIYEVVKNAFYENFKIFDFSKGFERYKGEWTDNLVNVNGVTFANSSLISTLILFKYSLKEKLRTFLKKSPAIVKFKRKKLGKIKYFFSFKHILCLFQEKKKA
jgi:CelD/BcsL family acetyltransferase involved in cellulose biosynthesis